jgi:streptogramin lyase
VTVAFDSVWVSNYLDSTITRIDPATGDVVAEIDTEFGPQIMAVAAGGLWVSSVDTDAVQRIDPATNEPGPPITTEALPDGLLEHDGSLWVATDLGPILQRLDPATGDITGTWVVSDQGAINANQLVVETGGAFWFPLLDGGEVLKVTIPS